MQIRLTHLRHYIASSAILFVLFSTCNYNPWFVTKCSLSCWSGTAGVLKRPSVSACWGILNLFITHLPIKYVLKLSCEKNRKLCFFHLDLHLIIFVLDFLFFAIEQHAKMEHVLASRQALRAGSAGLATLGHPGCATCRIWIGRACYIETIRAALAPEERRAGWAHYAIGVSALPSPGDFPPPLASQGRTTFRVSARHNGDTVSGCPELNYADTYADTCQGISMPRALDPAARVMNR